MNQRTDKIVSRFLNFLNSLENGREIRLKNFDCYKIFLARSLIIFNYQEDYICNI